MQRTCVKCGHHNPQATGAADEACPQCGAIYAKAQAQAPAPARPGGSQPGGQAGRASGFGGGRNSGPGDGPRAADDFRAFVHDMRSRSLYPTLRSFVNIGFYSGLLLAALVLAGGVLGSSGVGGMFRLLVACGVAAVIALVALAWRELSLMLADLSDAAVRLAAGTKRAP